MYIPRYSEELITEIDHSFKVLYVGGPRQVGKTTMLRHLAEGRGMQYVTLDDLSARRLAREDPDLFLQQYGFPLLIDEVQYAPELFPSIKLRVDGSNRKGQYWLTGSQQFSAMRNLQESLAGRVGIAHLLGLSTAEVRLLPRASDAFLPGNSRSNSRPMDVQDVFGHILRGSFPALWLGDPPPLETFYNSYIQTYIDRDLRDLFGVTKLSEFHTFLRLCAARTGQLLNYSDLARDAGVSVHAAREWMSILSETAQIYLLRPYHGNLSKRLIKSPKLYFLDTGLAAHLTGWKTVETLQRGAMAGAFFETFVVSELVKSYIFRGQEPPLFTFRDKEQHEVDILIEHEQQLYPVEVKLGARVTVDDLRNISYLRKKSPHLLSTGAVLSLVSQRFPIDREHETVPVGEIG